MSLKHWFPFYKPSVKMESPSSHISKSLSLLEEQEEKYHSFMDTAPLKDHILFLKLGLPFLEMFLSILDHKDLELHIKDKLYDVRLELHSLSNRRIKGSPILRLERAYSNLREKIKNLLVRQNIRMRLVDNDWMFQRKDSLMRISRYLLSNEDNLTAPLMEEIENFKEKVKLLQALFTYLAEQVFVSVENEVLLAPLSSLLHKATCLVYFFLVDKMDEETLEVKQELSDLVEKTNVKDTYMLVLRGSRSIESASKFYVIENLIQLLDCNVNFVINLNDTSKKYLFEELKFLQTFIINLPDELRLERFNFHFTSIEAIIWNFVLILGTCYDTHTKEDMAREVNQAVSEVLEKIKQVQGDSGEVKLYKFPKVDGVGFVDHFLGYLEELLKCQLESIEILKKEIETLYTEFKHLRSFLVQAKGQHNEHEELGDLWARFLGLAYLAEYVIDFYLVKNTLDSRILTSFSRIIKQTMLIKTEVTTIHADKKYHTQTHDVAKTPIHVLSGATDTATDEIVGFEDEAKKIKDYLFEDQEKLDIVSIVGMAGLGKTTLAKKVYEDPTIREFFHVQAWCTVSQTYEKRHLLLSILGDVIGNNDGHNNVKNEELAGKPLFTQNEEEMNDEDLAAKLFRSLKRRRYLIIIDDLWDIKEWDDFKRSFPDDRLHSRILITSRHLNLASQIKDGNKVHILQELSEVKSWELFDKKLFQKVSFSQEFLDAGRQIVKSCKGVPLTIVVMVGVLARVEKSVHKWKQIARELSSHIFNDSESQCKSVLELSYNHLPDHLKSCFLYFAAFREGQEISLKKLKMLWIAEGFVRYAEGKKLEDVAAEYFLDLINRSLIIPSKESSHGGVKACRVHDLLHDFCLQKAKEGSFLQVIHVPHWSKIARAYDERRLIIDFNEFVHREAKPCHNVRSLLHSGSHFHLASSNFSFIIQNFMLLRVLDLAGIFISMSESGIGLLIHLRYLAVRTDHMPSSITNLWYLQSLIITCSNTDDFVRDSLRNMVNLRHVRINRYGYFTIPSPVLGYSFLLYNVQTLSTPSFDSIDEAQNFLRGVPNLQRLKCKFDYCQEYDVHCSFRFPDLGFLEQLVSLKLIIKGSWPWEKNSALGYPPNLQKLSLIGRMIDQKIIAEIGRNLKVLKLSGRLRGGKWIVDDEDFPNLEYLKLSRLLIREWICSKDSFPMLAQLEIDRCENLNEIPPPCFGELCTLRVITVRSCRPSVHDSARQIEKVQQEELQNEEFKVYLTRWDPAASKLT